MMSVVGLVLMMLPWMSDAVDSVRMVAPDIGGMIYPATSSTSRHVQFGGLNSPSPTAYEFVASSTDSVGCSYARLCLQLKISSEFTTDPFFLHQYDSNYALTSTTFDTEDPNNILPLIPGGDQDTAWWFQSNATVTGPVIDLMLRLRQRSQRLSARDQSFVVVRVELVDPHTTTSSIESYGVYGNQLVTHKTSQVGTNTIQVQLSISINIEKQEVTPLDAYPLVTMAATGMDDSSSTATSCDDCDEFLDACQDLEPCQTVVLPCLITQLKALEVNASSSGSMEAGDAGISGARRNLESWFDGFGNETGRVNGEESIMAGGNNRFDFLEPLGFCVADIPLSTWAPLRRAIFCLAQFSCPLGTAQGSSTGDALATYFLITNGSQTFSVTPSATGTDNVDLSIIKQDIRPSVTKPEIFSYTASASYLGMFVGSFVLSNAASVSITFESDGTDTSTMQLSLEYTDAILFSTLSFQATAGELTMLQSSPPQAAIKFSASSSHPALDVFIDQLENRLQSTSDNYSWELAKDCVSCSSQLFGCPADAVESKSCNYNAAVSSFGQCIQQALPQSRYQALMAGSSGQTLVNIEISGCMDTISSNTDTLADSSSLACFSSTRCPFGPISLVEDTQMVVLETSSYIQLLRISPSASIDTVSIMITYSVNGILIGTTDPIYATNSESQIEQLVNAALNSTGIIGAASSSKNNAGSEWALEIIYQDVFLSSSFTLDTVPNADSVNENAIKQVVMEGGSFQLRVVPRDSFKIFTKPTTTDIPSPATPSSGPSNSTSRLSSLPTSDTCYQCRSALVRCQDNPGCREFSRTQLNSYLPLATMAAQPNSNDSSRRDIDLASTLQTLPSILVDSQEAWHAFSRELSCLSLQLCETGYEDSTTSSYQPSFLSVQNIAVIYQVWTFADTEWQVTIGNVAYNYTPPSDVTTSLQLAIPSFQHWLSELGRYDFDIVVSVVDWDGSSTTPAGAATFDVKFYGGYDSVSQRYTMLSPSLIPIFQVVGSTNAGVVENAGASYTLWDIKLWSVGQSPQYQKLLDLLNIGLGAAPTSSSTLSSSAHQIPSTDPCRKCSPTLARCQANRDCLSFTSVLAPMLAKLTPWPTSIFDNGTASFNIDLYPFLMLATMPPHNTSSVAWNLVAGEFYCLSCGFCDMEYNDVYVGDTNYHVPTDLAVVRSSFDVKLRTYSTTKWNIITQRNVYPFVPTDTVSASIEDSSLQFQEWLEAQGPQISPELVIQVHDRVVDDETQSAVLNISIFGSYDDELYQYLMVNPTMQPDFYTAGGTIDDGDGGNMAQAEVIFPSLIVSSTGQTPQYSKMLKMLVYGLGSTISSTTPAPTPTSATRSITSTDPCELQCQDYITACQKDDICATSSQDPLVSSLHDYAMAVSTQPEAEDGSARVALSISALLQSFGSFSEVPFHTRGSWDTFATELACFATTTTATCDLEYADVGSPLSGVHIPTSLMIDDASVGLSVLTYADTAWNMSLDTEILSYVPDPQVSDYATALYDWIESELNQKDLSVDQVVVQVVDPKSGATTISTKIRGTLTTTYGNLMPPLWLIPALEVTGGTTGGSDTGLPVAEATATPWDISMVTISQRPQYGKFLDLLYYGSSTPW